MKASFFAAGPDIVKGKTVAPFENVNLYPWLAHLLGLTPPKNDGSLNVFWPEPSATAVLNPRPTRPRSPQTTRKIK